MHTSDTAYQHDPQQHPQGAGESHDEHGIQKERLSWREQRLAVKVAAVIMGLVLALLLPEAAFRLRQYLKYGTMRPSVNDLQNDPIAKLWVPAPGRMTRNISINSLGFRSPELVNPKPVGTIRVAFLGASTTFCAEVSSNETTWPHLVWKTLQQNRPDIRFDYLNAAVSGYTTVQSIRNLEYRVKSQQPDVIVIYGDLPNDLSGDTREVASNQGIVRGSVDLFGGLARWSLTWFLVEKNLVAWRRQHEAMDDNRRTVTFVPEQLSAPFHSRLRELVRNAQQISPLVVLPTFSKRLRWNQTREEQVRASSTLLYYNPYMTIKGLLTAYDEYNRVTRLVARETGALLIEGEDSIPPDSAHFADSLHFTDLGAAVMAHRVSTALIASDRFQQLMAVKAVH